MSAMRQMGRMVMGVALALMLALMPMWAARGQAATSPYAGQFLDIRRYGAKADVTNDASGGINTALALAAVYKAWVWVPEGTFTIYSTVYVPGGVKLFGPGAIQESGVLSPMIWVNGTNATVADITVLGAETALTWSSVATNIQGRAGILFTANGGRAENVLILNKSTGLKMLSATDLTTVNVRHYNSWLTTALAGYNNASGILITGAGAGKAKVNGGWHIGTANGVLVGFTSYDINCIGVYCYDLLDNGFYYSSARNSGIYSCTTSNTLGSGATIRGMDLTVAGSFFNNGEVGYGISVTALAGVPSDADELDYSIKRGMPSSNYFNGRNISVINNTIKNFKNGAISFRQVKSNGITNYLHNVSATHNKIYNSSQTTGVDANNAHPVVSQADAPNLSDNEINGWTDIASVAGLVAQTPPDNGLPNFIDPVIHHNIMNSSNTAAAVAIQVSNMSGGTVDHNTTRNAVLGLKMAGCDGLIVDHNHFSDSYGLAGDTSTNVVVSFNVSGSQFSNASTPLRMLAYGNNPPILNSLELLKIDATNNTMSIGRHAFPSTHEYQPMFFRNDANNAMAVTIWNNVAVGAGNTDASARLALVMSDVSGYAGAFPADSSFSHLRRKVALATDSNALAADVSAGFPGQTVDLNSGGAALGAQLAGQVWRSLGGAQWKRTATAVNYAPATNDFYIAVTATATITLTNASIMFPGAVQVIASEGAGVTTTVARTGGDTIQGAAANDTVNANRATWYMTDGVSNWQKMGAF